MIKRLFTLFGTVAGCTLLLVTHTSCALGVCLENQWGYADGLFDHYRVTADHTTPEQIQYDPSGMAVSPEVIDRLTDEVETCLRDTFHGALPPAVAALSLCPRTVIPTRIDRQSFDVKVAADWALSCDGSQQLLPVLAGSAGCIRKGEDPTDACPCRYRAGIECPNHLVVTPSFYIYKDVLIRFVTGCINPWAAPQLAACAEPTTGPLG